MSLLHSSRERPSGGLSSSQTTTPARQDHDPAQSEQRDANLALVGVLAVYLLLYVLWRTFGWGGAANSIVLEDFALLSATMLAATLAWRASILAAGQTHLQRAWRIAGLAFVVYGLATVLQHVAQDRHWLEPVWLGASCGLLVGALGQHWRKRSWAQQAGTDAARSWALVRSSSNAVLITSPEGLVSYQSPAVGRLLGCPPGRLVGSRLTEVVHPSDRPRLLVYLAEASLLKGTVAPAEWRWRRSDGSWVSVETVATNLQDDPDVRGLVLESRDISNRKALEEQLTRQAFHDPVTGLPNRALFRNRVEHALARRRRFNGSLTVLFLDLDDFKLVNDRFGHAAGDALLGDAASRMLSCLRSGDTAARLGGDEFAILLEDQRSSRGGIEVAERVADALSQPFALDEGEVTITCSIGIASGSAELGADELLRHADVAMYAGKTRGKARYQIYQPAMDEAVAHRLKLKADLELAIERGELRLSFQPTVALATGRLTSLEALVRWEHPTQGLLEPAAFMTLAEETGLIIPIGRWVLREACSQAQVWQGLRSGSQPPGISVNLSPRQLHDPELPDQVAAALADSGLPPHQLVLEVSEHMLAQDLDATLERLIELKRRGVRLAVDDFGAGFASLSSLRHFPIDVLKIDKVFVDTIADEDEAAALASAIIELGRALELQVSAEGIELSGQLDHLRELGCDPGRDHDWPRALDASASSALLASPSPQPAPQPGAAA